MPGMTTGKQKLDLSNLTDEEAKHVWEVVQRDFDLRKKEEDRLGELKTKIEKEDTKRELLGHQPSLTGSYCIRCLQPFKFLVNSKRQCLDCHLYICKSCSRFNKKEHGAVCDPCHMARVLKIGTLEWYHENVRARFKRFGSAKVMRSLFKRLNREHSCSEDDLEADGHEEDGSDATDSQHYTGIKRPKRRLTVDPIDFELGCDRRMSRGQSNQAAGSHDILLMDVAVQESVLADADMASVFHHILEEQHTDVPDVLVYSDNPTILSSTTSQLSHSSGGSGNARGTRGCLPSPDGDSEEDDNHCLPYLLYHSHLGPSIDTSQERWNSGDPPTQASSNRTSPLPQELEGVDLEEQQLRKKLHEMTENISDHSLTSDEEESNRPHSAQEIPGWRSPDGYVKPSRLPVRPASSLGMVGYRLEKDQPRENDPQKTYHITDSEERKRPPIEEESKTSFRGSTALLVELEDQVAQAAASVQNAQSEVSDIENRIAALNAAGMSGDKRRKSAIPIQLRRLSSNFPTSQVDRFVRNSLYRGSLTQRNPVAKPKTITTCAKPVMKGS